MLRLCALRHALCFLVTAALQHRSTSSLLTRSYSFQFFHSSIIPAFQYSIAPILHYSITPSLHHSNTPLLQYSNIPFFHNLEPVRGKDRIPGKCFVHEKGRILKLLVSGAKKMPYGAIENFYLLLSNQVKWR